MSRQKMVCGLVFVVAAVVLMAVTSARAEVVSGSLLYLDAADTNGDGVVGATLPNNATWVNKGTLGSDYNATLGIAGDGSVDWAGTGTAYDPYTLQVRPGSNYYSGGYARVDSSYTMGNGLDLHTAYTYEVWAKINGNGSGVASGTNGGTLMGHNDNAVAQGNGSIGYAVTASTDGFQANTLFTQSGLNPVTTFPNSTDLVGAGYHQIVLARAGSGATDTAWYLDGVLKGTFQTGSIASQDSWFMIGGRNWSAHYDFVANADIAIARVYGSALTSAEVLQNYNADRGTLGVPEPSTLVLLAIGLFGLLAYAWRKRK